MDKYFSFLGFKFGEYQIVALLLAICATFLFILLFKKSRQLNKMKNENLPGPGEKKLAKLGKYLFEIIILTDGVNRHTKLRSSDLEFTYLDLYEVKADALYSFKRKRHEWIKHRFHGIKSWFLCVFKENKKNAITFSDPTVYPSALKTVEESKALIHMLKEEFKKAMNPKTLFIVFLVVIVMALVILVATGKINLPGVLI